jgi:hypothetical protein
VLARVGPAGAWSMKIVVSQTTPTMDHSRIDRIERTVEADPSNVHGIVHLAPSMSRPLRAARGGLRPAWTSPP